MHTQFPEKLITIDELADRLGGLGRSTVYRHIRNIEGFPQPIKVGASTRFRHSDVEAFIAQIAVDRGGPF